MKKLRAVHLSKIPSHTREVTLPLTRAGFHRSPYFMKDAFPDFAKMMPGELTRVPALDDMITHERLTYLSRKTGFNYLTALEELHREDIPSSLCIWRVDTVLIRYFTHPSNRYRLRKEVFAGRARLLTPENGKPRANENSF